MSLASYLKAAQYDLENAANRLYPSDKKVETAGLNRAVYDSVQAFEKILKAIVTDGFERNNPFPSYDKLQEHNDLIYSHDMRGILLEAEKYSNGLIAKHSYLSDNSYAMGKDLNMLRYPTHYSLPKKSAYIIYKEARDFYNETVCKYYDDVVKQNSLLISETLDSEAEREWCSLKPPSRKIKNENSKYDYSNR